LAIKKNYLRLILIIALIVGGFGIVLSAFLASFIFLLYSLPNFSLAAFFGYKYYTYDKSIRNVKERRKDSSNRRFKPKSEK
jgi:ABC-type Fe3+-siderophore transport system permease subunit